MNPNRTKEPQYQFLVEREKTGLPAFGMMSGQVWQDDPRRLGFVLARYKFVSKMFDGMNKVLEVGCADGFGSRVVRQTVSSLTAVDFDPIFIENAVKNRDPRWPVEFLVHDVVSKPIEGLFDAAYALDVIEHIREQDELQFLENIVSALSETGVIIFGCPSIHSQPYASAPSREGHVNCKDAPGMKKLLGAFFHHVFVFSMNDEVVHTGFHPMAHYLLGMAVHPKA